MFVTGENKLVVVAAVVVVVITTVVAEVDSIGKELWIEMEW